MKNPLLSCKILLDMFEIAYPSFFHVLKSEDTCFFGHLHHKSHIVITYDVITPCSVNVIFSHWETMTIFRW